MGKYYSFLLRELVTSRSSLSQGFACNCPQEPGTHACVEGLAAAMLRFPMQQSSVAGASPSFCSSCYLNRVLSENTFGTGKGSCFWTDNTPPAPF